MRCWPRHGTSWRTTVFLLGASPARTTRFTCVQYLGFGEAGIGSSSVPRATEVISVQGTTTNSGPMSTSRVGQDYLTAGDRRGKGVFVNARAIQQVARMCAWRRISPLWSSFRHPCGVPGRLLPHCLYKLSASLQLRQVVATGGNFELQRPHT